MKKVCTIFENKSKAGIAKFCSSAKYYKIISSIFCMILVSISCQKKQSNPDLSTRHSTSGIGSDTQSTENNNTGTNTNKDYSNTDDIDNNNEYQDSDERWSNKKNEENNNQEESENSDENTEPKSVNSLNRWDPEYQAAVENEKINIKSEHLLSGLQISGGARTLNNDSPKYTAKILGVLKDENSCNNSMIDQIFISYSGNPAPLNATLDQARRCAKSHPSCNSLGRKDRIALVAFGNCAKFKKWKHADLEKINSVNDYKSDAKDKYPKIQLQLVQTMTKIYDPKNDKYNDITYTMDKSCTELKDSMNGAKYSTTRNGTRAKYKTERVLKTFKYVCALTDGCGKWSWQRDRDAFVFVGRNDCTPGEISFTKIHSLMEKGAPDNSGLRRVIKLKKKIGKDECSKVYAFVDFVWRLKVKYKDTNGKVREYVQEIFVNKTFF